MIEEISEKEGRYVGELLQCSKWTTRLVID
jgi:hypothetical protein